MLYIILFVMLITIVVLMANVYVLKRVVNTMLDGNVLRDEEINTRIDDLNGALDAVRYGFTEDLYQSQIFNAARGNQICDRLDDLKNMLVDAKPTAPDKCYCDPFSPFEGCEICMPAGVPPVTPICTCNPFDCSEDKSGCKDDCLICTPF